MSDYDRWLMDIARNYGTLSNYFATDGEEYEGDPMAAYQAWLDVSEGSGPVTLTLVASHSEHSSGVYAQYLVLDSSGYAHVSMYCMGHPDGASTVWTDSTVASLTYQHTETFPPTWFDERMFDGPADTSGRIASDNEGTLVIANADGSYDYYTETYL